MYRSASQLILARSNLRLGFRSILLFTITITVDTSAQVPGPKRDFILSLGFALQRANSNMLRRADERRRQAIASNKYSSRTRARDLGV